MPLWSGDKATLSGYLWVTDSVTRDKVLTPNFRIYTEADFHIYMERFVHTYMDVCTHRSGPPGCERILFAGCSGLYAPMRGCLEVT